MGAYPEIPLAVFKKSGDGALREGGRIPRLIGVMPKGTCRGIEQIQAAVDATHPKPPFRIRKQAFDHIAAQTGFFLIRMTKAGERGLLRIKAENAVIFGAQPEISLTVRTNGEDLVSAWVCGSCVIYAGEP